MFKMCLNNRGQAAIIVGIALIFLVGMVGLGIDIGLLLYEKENMQNAVDLAALTVVHELPEENHGQAVSSAQHAAMENGIKKKSNIHVKYPYNGDYNKIEIIGRKNHRLLFLSIFGKGNMKIEVRAVAGVEYEGKTSYSDIALDYAVFHGSQLTDMHMHGNGSLVNGNVHSNKKIAIHGAHSINGDVSAVDGISGDMSNITGTITSKEAPIIPMPDIGFDSLAAKADRVYNSNQIFNNVTIDGIWLINGDVKLNGGRINGRGIILATGNIDLPTNSVEYSSSNDLLALYSLGDISLSCTNNNINGVLYAPNGRIKISGSYNTFYGALIANEVWWATKDITINGSYDIRTPQAFDVNEKVFRLYE